MLKHLIFPWNCMSPIDSSKMHFWKGINSEWTKRVQCNVLCFSIIVTKAWKQNLAFNNHHCKFPVQSSHQFVSLWVLNPLEEKPYLISMEPKPTEKSTNSGKVWCEVRTWSQRCIRTINAGWVSLPRKNFLTYHSWSPTKGFTVVMVMNSNVIPIKHGWIHTQAAWQSKYT